MTRSAKKATKATAAKKPTPAAKTAEPQTKAAQRQPPTNVYEDDFDVEGWAVDNSHWFKLRGVWFSTRALTLSEEEQLVADINGVSAEEGGMSEGDFFKRVIAEDQYGDLMAMIDTPQGPDNPAGPVRSATRKQIIRDIINVVTGAADPKPRDC